MSNLTTNHCGTCTMCCNLLAVEEIEKPTNKWCKHCVVGTGCRIYAERPVSCQTYECVWLTLKNDIPDGIPDELRPDRCHTIIDYRTEDKFHHVRCDPSHPNAWRSPLVQAFIMSIVDAPGEQVWLISGDNRYRIRAVTVGEK